MLNQTEPLEIPDSLTGTGYMLLTDSGLISIDHDDIRTSDDNCFRFAGQSDPDKILATIVAITSRKNEKIACTNPAHKAEWEKKVEDDVIEDDVNNALADNDNQRNRHTPSQNAGTKIVIEFETGSQGQGYSLPSLLQARLPSEARFYACGRLIPDQARMLLSCGFDGVLIQPDLLERHGLENWQNAAVFHATYQFGR